jgi:hypothetical protein
MKEMSPIGSGVTDEDLTARHLNVWPHQIEYFPEHTGVINQDVQSRKKRDSLKKAQITSVTCLAKRLCDSARRASGTFLELPHTVAK